MDGLFFDFVVNGVDVGLSWWVSGCEFFVSCFVMCSVFFWVLRFEWCVLIVVYLRFVDDCLIVLFVFWGFWGVLYVVFVVVFFGWCEILCLLVVVRVFLFGVFVVEFVCV